MEVPHSVRTSIERGSKMVKRLKVKVSHGKDRIIEETDFIRVYTMEPREMNKANIDVMKQISRYYGIPSTSVKILSGFTSRNKLVEIDD